MTINNDCRFAESHEWACKEGDHIAMGISHFAAKQLGDIVYVELPAVGSPTVKGQAIGVIESVKAASDVFAPISGIIVDVNEDLISNPGLINKDSYGKGWILKIAPNSAGEMDTLMSAAAYAQEHKDEH